VTILFFLKPHLHHVKGDKIFLPPIVGDKKKKKKKQIIEPDWQPSVQALMLEKAQKEEAIQKDNEELLFLQLLMDDEL
jgi:hypothetical protein